MPYIKEYQRVIVEDEICRVANLIKHHTKEDPRLSRPGYLNYTITKLLLEVYGDNLRYADYNEIMGMLTCCMHELYRRGCAPYEDTKILSEGDVYPVKPVVEPIVKK